MISDLTLITANDCEAKASFNSIKSSLIDKPACFNTLNCFYWSDTHNLGSTPAEAKFTNLGIGSFTISSLISTKAAPSPHSHFLASKTGLSPAKASFRSSSLVLHLIYHIRFRFFLPFSLMNVCLR
jgi:hypothetical protein